MLQHLKLAESCYHPAQAARLLLARFLSGMPFAWNLNDSFQESAFNEGIVLPSLAFRARRPGL
jgi:hypothetical protein